jgi:hypothetical protein
VKRRYAVREFRQPGGLVDRLGQPARGRDQEVVSKQFGGGGQIGALKTLSSCDSACSSSSTRR